MDFTLTIDQERSFRRRRISFFDLEHLGHDTGHLVSIVEPLANDPLELASGLPGILVQA